MAGDPPSLVIGPSGLSSYNTATPLVKLGPSAASLLKPGGTSLVIYAQADDDRTQPDGNAGARIGCGVIVQDLGNSVQLDITGPSSATGTDSRLGALLIGLGGIVLIAVGVGLRQKRLRL